MSPPTKRPHLLVGISNPATMPGLVDLAVRLGASLGSDIALTHVVTVPGQIGLGSARSSPEVVAARRLLESALDRAQEAGTGAKAVVEVGREVHEGLLAAARSCQADIVMVGYSEPYNDADEASERRFDRVMHRVERDLDADLVICKFRGDTTDRILVPVEPASDFPLIGMLLAALTKDRPGSVTFLLVSPLDDPSGQVEAVRDRLATSGLSEVGELEVVSGDDIAEVVLAQARDQDLVLLETTSAPAFKGGLRGAAERITDDAACSTVIVRAGRKG